MNNAIQLRVYYNGTGIISPRKCVEKQTYNCSNEEFKKENEIILMKDLEKVISLMQRTSDCKLEVYMQRSSDDGDVLATGLRYVIRYNNSKFSYSTFGIHNAEVDHGVVSSAVVKKKILEDFQNNFSEW